MTQKTRVLIAVPYHEQKRYCLGQLYDSLEAIAADCWLDQDIEVEIVVRHDLKPFGQKDNVKIQREFFRRLVLDYEFDYLFFHGADTMPPADVISRLLSHNVPIVSGVYFQRGEKKALNAIAWMNNYMPEEKNEYLSSVTAPYLVPVHGMGLDCCLIERGVLQRISWSDWDVNDDDYPFCDAATAIGIPLFVDRSVQCKHWSEGAAFSFLGKHHEL